MTGYLGFVGVTTSGSSIMKVFPEWAAVLGLPTSTLRGHDVPLDAEPEVYRRLVEAIRDDSRHYGALVTTHKLAVYQAAGDLFDELDSLAQIFGEISSIAKRGDQLIGAAKDPITVRLALQEFVADDYFGSTGAAALVLGAGGSGCALTQQLALRSDRPTEIIVTDRRESHLDHLRQILERSGVADDAVRLVLTERADQVDALLAALPEGTLVVNATGLGKDRPGSPLSDRAVFPRNAVVWEFNYRGTLEFLRQAAAQQTRAGLVVEDGWRYFVHGWSQVVGDVFGIEMTPETVDELSRVAARFRG